MYTGTLTVKVIHRASVTTIFSRHHILRNVFEEIIGVSVQEDLKNNYPY